MIAKNDEKKRSELWRVAMVVSSVLIIVIAIFFGFKLFTSNPLEGKWVNEDSGLIMRIQGNGSATIEWPDGEEDTVELKYQVDLKSKILTLYQDEDGGMTADDYEASAETGFAADTMEGTYDYSQEQGELTLTEREYGEQMVFFKE